MARLLPAVSLKTYSDAVQVLMEECIAASHANLIARLPQARSPGFCFWRPNRLPEAQYNGLFRFVNFVCSRSPLATFRL
jgi:hypothetical protein